jgi:hypothetical protein
MRAVPAQTLAAHGAIAAGQVDFPGHPAADPGMIAGVHNFGHKFMAGDSGEAVIPALQLEIRTANTPSEQPE